mmetsp:Transcript_8167/g.24181  ORF Transcript_8167/g.24181 Transcript_8167/m.24181 type:complete len:125 (-) Transcript_8167:4039-4413(-)
MRTNGPLQRAVPQQAITKTYRIRLARNKAPLYRQNKCRKRCLKNTPIGSSRAMSLSWTIEIENPRNKTDSPTRFPYQHLDFFMLVDDPSHRSAHLPFQQRPFNSYIHAMDDFFKFRLLTPCAQK